MEQQTTSVIQQILQSCQQTQVQSNSGAQTSSGFKPRPKFDPAEDVGALDKATTSKEADIGTIIDILTKRTNEQRQEIRTAYLQKTGKSLDDILKKTLSRPLRDICLALLKTPADSDADSLRSAIKGPGTDEDVLIEICVTRNNQQINAIKTAYKEEYKTELVKDIADDTSGDFQKILLDLLKAERSEDGYVNEDLANKDAEALYVAGEKNKKVHSETFINIFTSRSPTHLRKVFEKYSTHSKHDLNEALDLNLKGDFESCLVAIVKCVTNKSGFFAEKLHLAVKGLGIRERMLTRVMVSCSEIMKDIKLQYKEHYKIALRDVLMKKTKGDYQTVVIALCGYDEQA